ncbi:MAG: DNA translocase FtsK [Verrucomicrobiae bacterium]|nr:DNA translocase FtsK [Verrucomicrobiae bacterium]
MKATTRRDFYRREMIGIGLFCGALLLLLSLLSYSSDEVFFHRSNPNPCTNWVGPVGLYLAFGSFFAFGFAAYLLPILLGVIAGYALWGERFKFWVSTLLMLGVVIAGSALIDLPNYFLEHDFLGAWQARQDVASAGGYIGSELNSVLLVRFFGRGGSILIWLTIYFTCLILLLQIKPLTLIRAFGPWLRNAIYQWQLKRADAAKALEIQKKKLMREQQQLQKRLKKSGVPLETPPEEELPIARPEPRIIDTSTLAHSEILEPEEEEITKPVINIKEKRRVKTVKAASPEPKTEMEYKNYILPSLDLLSLSEISKQVTVSQERLQAEQQLLLETLKEFGIEATPGDITRGPTITRYELYPARGVRVEKIQSLDRNIARAMKTERINILAPVPGKDSVAVELANSDKVAISLRDLFETPQWKNNRAKIPLALGKDVYGSTLVADLAEMPHMLIAGTTGSGKSVCINCILLSLLYCFNPEDLRIILIDPKVVEMQCYNHLPHLVVPVVTEPKKVLVALRWVINEMEKRYVMMARAGVRNIAAFNARPQSESKVEKLDLEETLAHADDEEETETQEPLVEEEKIPSRFPYIVVIIDELADLMQTAPKDVENAIARLTAKARAAGIHLIVATQTPRAQVVTGVIKTNIPCRIAFQVPSALDSRVILDEPGAENLLGKGDMLYLMPGAAKLIRAQGAFVSDDEVASVVAHIRNQAPATYEAEIHRKLSQPVAAGEEVDEEDEALYQQCLEIVHQEKKASTSLLQRRLRLGYTRAARIMDMMERRGIVGPENGAKPRELLVDLN